MKTSSLINAVVCARLVQELEMHKQSGAQYDPASGQRPMDFVRARNENARQSAAQAAGPQAWSKGDPRAGLMHAISRGDGPALEGVGDYGRSVDHPQEVQNAVANAAPTPASPTPPDTSDLTSQGNNPWIVAGGTGPPQAFNDVAANAASTPASPTAIGAQSATAGPSAQQLHNFLKSTGTKYNPHSAGDQMSMLRMQQGRGSLSNAQYANMPHGMH